MFSYSEYHDQTFNNRDFILLFMTDETVAKTTLIRIYKDDLPVFKEIQAVLSGETRKMLTQEDVIRVFINEFPKQHKIKVAGE